MRINDLDKIAADLSNVPGDCAEFGCFEGESTLQIAEVFKPRRVWAWDTFAGMPDDDYNADLDSGNPPGKWTPGEPHPIIKFAKSGLDIVPIVGKYSFTIPHFKDEMPCPLCKHAEPIRFAFVHIDCDHYEAYKRVLDFITPRMSTGGLVRWDDMDCKGAIKAIDEFLTRTGKQRNNEWIRF